MPRGAPTRYASNRPTANVPEDRHEQLYRLRALHHLYKATPLA